MQPVLGHEDAAIAVETIRDELARRGKSAVIAVADAHGELLALLRTDGAPLSSIAVATNKAWTAARLRRATRVLGAGVRARGIEIGYYGDPRLTGFGGGVPGLGRRAGRRRHRRQRAVRRGGRGAGAAGDRRARKPRLHRRTRGLNRDATASQRASHAAVDDDLLAADIGGSVGGEEHRDAGEVAGLAPATQRHACIDALDERRILAQARAQVGLEIAGRDRVAGDAVLAQLGCERAREAGEPRFRRRRRRGSSGGRGCR